MVFCLFKLSGSKSQNFDIKDKTIYQFVVEDIYGSKFNFADLKGKKIMIVNTASKCGLTPQYKVLQTLYDRYKDNNFIIIGFPSNDFLWQEPGTNEDIAAFCKENYGVTFPIMSKIRVKGSDQHPLYSFLTQKKLNGVLDTRISWNFQKILINKNGHVYKSISPSKSPDNDEIINWITNIE